MAMITTEKLNELKNEAITYITANKGNDISKDDIIVAENLMVFGYIRGLEEIQNEKKSGGKNPEAFN